MKKYLKYADLAMAALGLISLIMIFLPAITLEDTSYSGWNLIFGHSTSTEVFGSTVTTEFFGFSFMNLLTVILTVGSIVCAVLSFVKKNELFYLISAACALVAAIFFFLIKTFAAPANKLMEVFVDEASLSAGPIIAAILLFIAVACGVVKKAFDK